MDRYALLDENGNICPYLGAHTCTWEQARHYLPGGDRASAGLQVCRLEPALSPDDAKRILHSRLEGLTIIRGVPTAIYWETWADGMDRVTLGEPMDDVRGTALCDIFCRAFRAYWQAECQRVGITQEL